ncbi:MAG TPA: OmpA family protein [Verrucomicrobiae bacterium]|nr:OmpA family protein [Verrucomicrobiae bacterium]
MNKSLFALATALAAVLVSAGCTHRPANVTDIPGNAGLTDENPFGSKYNPNAEGQIAEASPDSFDGMAMDRQALAVYSLHFAYDSAAIRKTERANLQAVAATLQSDPSTKLLIEGNCDERGTEEYNRSLGQRRADAAREALVKLGLSPDRIRTLSNGKDKPLDPGHDESAWSQNRRDDFILLRPKAGA